jgi:tetratricopeptide (TPR) repeat protein
MFEYLSHVNMQLHTPGPRVLIVALLAAAAAPSGFSQKVDRKKSTQLMEQGLAAEAAGDNKAALAFFDELIRTSGEGPDPKALYHRGLAYSALGDTTKALDDYNRAVSLRLEYAPLFISRAALFTKQGQHARAADDFSKAIKLRLDDQNAWKGRGSAYMALAHYRDAIDDLDQAIRLKPDFLDALVDRAYC